MYFLSAFFNVYFQSVFLKVYLSDPGVSGVRSMGLLVSNSLRDVRFNLTDVTQADEDTNSILADNANRAIQGNVAM